MYVDMYQGQENACDQGTRFFDEVKQKKTQKKIDSQSKTVVKLASLAIISTKPK